MTAANVGGVASYWSQYVYDALGNRTSQTEHTSAGTETTTYQHGTAGVGPHQLTSMTRTTGSVGVTTGFGWDAAGNRTSRTVNAQQQTQAWDAEGKLTATTGGAAGNTSNVYAADGSRLVRTDPGGVTVFLPGGQEIHATATAVTATRWYTFAGSTVAVRSGVGLAGVSSVVTDAHGTPLAAVKNTNWAAAVTRIRTDPFGAARTGQTGTLAGRGFLAGPADATGLTLLGSGTTTRARARSSAWTRSLPPGCRHSSTRTCTPGTTPSPGPTRPGGTGSATHGTTSRVS